MNAKVVLIGEAGVGKTCITNRFVSNSFSPEQPATVSGSFMKKLINKTTLLLWDTAGQEKFRSLAPLYYQNAFAIVVVFDLTDASSFE